MVTRSILFDDMHCLRGVVGIGLLYALLLLLFMLRGARSRIIYFYIYIYAARIIYDYVYTMKLLKWVFVWVIKLVYSRSSLHLHQSIPYDVFTLLK